MSLQSRFDNAISWQAEPPNGGFQVRPGTFRLHPILLLIGLMPVAISPTLFVYFDAMPRAALLLGTSAALLFGVQRARPGLAKLLSCPRGKAFIVLMLAQILSLFISASYGNHPVLSFFGTGWRRLGVVSQIAILLCALFIAAEVAASPQRLAGMFRVVSATGVIVALYGIAQYFGWDPILHADVVKFSGQFRPPSTFGNPTYFANYLLFVTLSGLGLAIETKPRLWSLLGWTAAGTGAFALLLTGTRSAILGLIAGLVVIILKARPRFRGWHAITAGAFVMAVLCFVLSDMGTKLRDRLEQWSQDRFGGPRLLLWADEIRLARAHWVLGTGPESFASEFPHFQSEKLARAYPDFYEESAHNICLDSLTAQGIPGIVLLVSLFLIGAIPPRGNGHRTISAILRASIVAGFISHQFTVFIIPTALLYYLSVGASVGLQASQADGTCTVLNRTFSPVRAAMLPIAALFIAVAAQLTYIDLKWRSVKRQVDAGNVYGASLEYSQVTQLQPFESGLDLWYSRALVERLGKLRDAQLNRDAWPQLLYASQRACRTSEDPQNAFYNLAVICALKNDISGMEAALRSAVECAPNWYKPHWLLAELLLQSGRLNAAEAEAGRAVRLSGEQGAGPTRTLEAVRKSLKEGPGS